MEHKFRKSDNDIDLQALLDFCKKEGKMVEYRKGEQLEREGDPARWFGFVESGCFKFITRGFSDGRDHLTWFSFEGEFVADYPCVLSGQTSQATIEAMMPCRVWRVSGEELLEFFRRSIKNMELRAAIGRCPGIVEHLNLQDIASFLNVTPKTISKIRKEITFSNK